MRLRPPEKLERLRKKLHVKAKQEPSCRFHALYDKIWREDTLAFAYELARANRGAPGVDGKTFDQIEAEGRDRWLEELREELREERYRPKPVRRVMIPKPGGGERPLGIPTIRDRVVQTAAVLILEPIFEADFDESAHGYRPGRSALDAVRSAHQGTYRGEHHVVDADLSKFFDTIPHADLLKSVARRVVDGKVLRLIKMWLKVPVEERDERGRRRYTGGKRSKMGTPQGGVISPLLANIYINRFLRHWRQSGRTERLGRLVNYADDFVILCRSRFQAEQALAETRQIMRKIGLTVNERKTRLCDARRERFTFLGYEVGARASPINGRTYIGAAASKQSVDRLKGKLRALLARGSPVPWPVVVGRLNRLLRGWAGYFSYGSKAQIRRNLARFVAERVRRLLQRRHKVRSRGTRRFGWVQCYGALGVHCLDPIYSRKLAENAHALA